MHLRKPNKFLTKSFFRFQPHFSHSSSPSPHAIHTGLLLFPQSMPGSSMTQIHQKCFSSHLLTCLAKLCSSLKMHIKYYSFGKTCGFTHIVLLYPFSQSSLFIFFMALITFNFTHIWLFVLECLSPQLLKFKLHKEQHPFSWHLYT